MKHLSRGELLDIIYELQRRYEESEAGKNRLQAALDKKELCISEAGSIAEAALKISGVFEAAQAAADQYLLSIRTENADISAQIETVRKQNEEILRQANQEAEQIVKDAERKAEEIVETANQEAAKSWEQFQQKANELLRTRAELNALVKRD